MVVGYAMANEAGSSTITLVRMFKNFMGLFIFSFLSSLLIRVLRALGISKFYFTATEKLC